MSNLGSGAINRGHRTRNYTWLHLIDVQDMLERLEITNIHRATTDEWLFSCPFPGHKAGDSKPSAYMNDGTKDKRKATLWKCHGCGREGNAISLFAEHEATSKGDAAQQLKETYAPNFRPPKGGSMTAELDKWIANRKEEPEEDELVPISLDHYDALFSDWTQTAQDYMWSRGFELETLKHWRIGYDRMSARITIPVFHDGELIGVKGRAIRSDEKVKYRILGDKPGTDVRYGFRSYPKSRVVYGTHNLDIYPIKFPSEVILVEGELDVIALWQMGVVGLSTGSAAMSVTQAKIIRQYADTVILFLDSDNAGKNATWGFQTKDEWRPGIVDKLEPFVKVKVVPDHDNDPAGFLEEHNENAVYELLSQAKSSTQLRTSVL